MSFDTIKLMRIEVFDLTPQIAGKLSVILFGDHHVGIMFQDLLRIFRQRVDKTEMSQSDLMSREIGRASCRERV